MTPTERKRAQRKRDRLAGWNEVTLKVPADRIEELRAFVASLPPPPPPTDPAQLSMLVAIDLQLAGGDVSPKGSEQPQRVQAVLI